MKHLDISGVTLVDWQQIIDQLPPTIRLHYDEHRKYRAERCIRLLNSLAKGEGGLTTYDPDDAGWIKGEERFLESFAEYLERGEMYAREREFGVIEAARQICLKANPGQPIPKASGGPLDFLIKQANNLALWVLSKMRDTWASLAAI